MSIGYANIFSSMCNSPILLDLFYYLIMCVYMCLYVINCLCMYSGLELVVSVQRGNMVILDSRVLW